MRPIFKLLFAVLLSVVATGVFAQARFDVSGLVTNEKGEPLKSATVFIGGSNRVMPTDENGRFKFTRVAPGTFRVSVQMLGYAPASRNIMVLDAPITIELRLTPKAITLNEVRIGKKRALNNNLRLFEENFLGTSNNARQTKILNPEIINFSTTNGILLAETDEFLIIDNKRLGYRIHYLLKDFSYNTKANLALYHGECSFEDMEGTVDDKKKWARNRAETYQGSFMHFLRSVYTNSAQENGFLTRPMYGYGNFRYEGTYYSQNPSKINDGVVVKDHLVQFDSLVTAYNANLIAFKFNQLHVVYDPRKAATFKPKKYDGLTTIPIDKNASMVRLTNPQSLIDQKGSYIDYRDFYIRGNWAIARVGDQLPVDYVPPSAPISHRNEAVDKLTIALQKWTDSIPQEKVYLHMDKPHYAPGDTIWFKGYLTTGSKHELSAISGAVYVDLLNQEDIVIKSVKLPVTSGMVSGQFILNDDLTEGGYHVRAYTQWMRNAGVDYFFNRAFNIGVPAKIAEKKKEKQPILQQTDVQFFPESGNLVTGVTSRVAFKAIGTNGLGTAITGKVTDNDNNEVAQLNALHAGMGSFFLRPQPGKSYTATINFADGSTKTIALPAPLDAGYVLSVYQPNKDSVLVRVNASPGLQQSTVIVLAHSGGETVFASPVTLSGPITSIWFDKKLFRGGVAQFTLFNNESEPLNERVAFIKGDDKLKLDIKTAREVYKSKERVQLDLTASDSEAQPTQGNFSIAVIDATQIPVEESAESTIFSNILLTSDIKGYIEKPNYYFTAETDTVNTALDNLMLTQGYRRFEWSTLPTVLETKPVYEAEGLGSSISGVVTSLSHKPSPNAQVKLLSMRAGLFKDTVTDENGRFRFDRIFIGDSIKFTIQARDANNSNKVRIEIDRAPEIDFGNGKNPKGTNSATAAQLKIHQQQVEQEGQTVKLNQLHILKQVEIKGRKKPVLKDNITSQQMFTVPEGSADQIITIPDPENYNTLTQALQARLPGISIEVDEVGLHRMLSMRPSAEQISTIEPTDKFSGREIGLIIDGRKIRSSSEADELLEGGILMEDVAKIEVIRTNQALINTLRDPREGYVGYVLLITKPSTARKRYYPSIANIMPKGFNKARKFYSPRYDVPEAERQPDLRTTIYWNPYLITDANGKSTFDFYNGDGPGTYRVVVEGINANGELGRQVYTYKVE
jgi:hypothetical protein